jgi:hypothetical protein
MELLLTKFVSVAQKETEAFRSFEKNPLVVRFLATISGETTSFGMVRALVSPVYVHYIRGPFEKFIRWQ